MKLWRRDDGQATVLAAVFMFGMVVLAAFVLDVGSWFRQQRASQATVDAAALAGAQVLPKDPTRARAIAADFASRNGGIAGATITVSSKWSPNDMITVSQTGAAPGFFSQILGIGTVDVSAHASAVIEVPAEAKYVAPITVNIKHPKLSGPGCPCIGINNVTTLPLGKTGAPGAFAMLNLDPTDITGTVGSSILADWITNGYDQNLPLGEYFSDPGAKFNDSKIQAALQGRFKTDLLFPVYDELVSQGSNAEYHIIGWVAFHLTDVQASGTGGSLTGYFTDVIWQGAIPPSGPPSPAIPDLGVYTVALID
jgi:Flp pilus assembly protein TadG